MEKLPRRQLTAGRVTAIYLFVGLLWIGISDILVSQFFTPSQQFIAQVWKGATFVLLSALLLYALLSRENRRRDRYERRLRRNLQHVSVVQRVMRHDIRTASNILLGYADLLRASVSPENERHLDVITDQSERLAQLSEKVSRMVALDRPDDVEVNIVGLVEEVCDDIAARYPASVIDMDLPNEELLLSSQVDVLARELVENAAEHGGGKIVVELDIDSGAITLTVRDDGPGLPDAEMAMFDRELEDPLFHSQGVGLWLVRLLVAEMGGNLDVSSGNGTGTTVRAVLPRGGGTRAPSGNPLIRDI